MQDIRLKNGERLEIAEARAEDAEELLAHLETVTAETDMLAAGPGEMGLSLADEKAFIRAMAMAEHSVLLCGRVKGELAVVASLEGAARPRCRHNAELGISVKKAFWGLGAGRAMMEALLDWAQSRPGLRCIQLGMRVDNKPAFALYRKLGFTACGLRRNYLKIGKHYYDELLMERLLPERD